MGPQNQAKDTSAQKELPPLVRKSLESGLICKTAVSENRRPETSVEESINFDFDTIGSATLRKGTTIVGGSLGSTVLGMHYFVDTVTAGANTKLVAVANTSAYYLAGGDTWTAIRNALTPGSKARFTTYLNFMFMVNGTENTAVWNGSASTSFVTTGNALSAPKGTVIENFRSRIWIAGNTTYPDRLYYSTIPTTVATPIVVWDTNITTGQWIDISPSDGDTITALQRYRNKMLVFKTNHLYRVFDIGQTDPDPYYAVGTSSQESVVETKVGIFFHHATGFYQYNVNDVVQEISRPIMIDIIRNIAPSAYTSITGWVEPDGDHVCWSVGNVTIRGVTYANLVVRYTISTQTWTHRMYPAQMVNSIRRQPLYVDATTQYALVGDSTGAILKTNTGKDDNGTPITYSLIHRWETVDGLLSTRKVIQTANFLHYGGAESQVTYQTEKNDPDNLNDWTLGIGQLNTTNTGFNSMDIKGRKFRFRISGVSTGEPFTYNGYEVLGVLNEFIQFDPQ